MGGVIPTPEKAKIQLETPVVFTESLQTRTIPILGCRRSFKKINCLADHICYMYQTLLFSFFFLKSHLLPRWHSINQDRLEAKPKRHNASLNKPGRAHQIVRTVSCSSYQVLGTEARPTGGGGLYVGREGGREVGFISVFHPPPRPCGFPPNRPVISRPDQHLKEGDGSPSPRSDRY